MIQIKSESREGEFAHALDYAPDNSYKNSAYCTIYSETGSIPTHEN